MVIGTDCTDSCKSNYHTLSTTMASSKPITNYNLIRQKGKKNGEYSKCWMTYRRKEILTKENCSLVVLIFNTFQHQCKNKGCAKSFLILFGFSLVYGVYIDANHYDFSVIVMNFGPKLRCYGQQSTCYGFPIIAGPKPFPI